MTDVVNAGGHPRRYRIIDHTADLGLRVYGTTAVDLYESAARAMFDQIVDTRCLTGRDSAAVAVTGIDRADLMVNWLRELLYLWTGKGKLVKTVHVRRLSAYRLSAAAVCDDFDPHRHGIKTEIKAVTYHRSRVFRSPGGWQATIIFDV